ncbi:hypothetical protein HanXRQr2_Chr03g0096061 [Helianthus annuus]|uniref:Uncharacterized protein n=1 Tax=Helianthus annuus TaxID=4232 RepID=A0A251TVX4_HELAN|nr:hypothetical protein HanXRQr2_Chr03g0096061 [Helianthus annuus]KAJ0942503.1 hypothetical protein HanPSC8_Chr03g0092681 [Helianthus annuus]
MQKGRVIDTRGRSIVAKRKLLAVDNDDDHGERDMRFHGTYILMKNKMMLNLMILKI